MKERNGKFREVNDEYYRYMEQGFNISRFKLYIAKLFSSLRLRTEKLGEIEKLKKARRNISSVITTNYGQFIEKELGFIPLIGNNILLSNPYGSVYKIHGSVDAPADIVITAEDYVTFDERYTLIQAQVLSTFIYHPIVFLGYSLQDQNIRKLLKAVFLNVDPNSELGNKVRNNFLLVNYEAGSSNLNLTDFDATLDESGHTVRIKQLATDNYSALYDAISMLDLPVSAMDIRKVHDVIRDIHSGGKIKVKVVDDINDMQNGDRVIAIGTNKTVSVTVKTKRDLIIEYFELIESRSNAILAINSQPFSEKEYFPVFGFAQVCEHINKVEIMKQREWKRVLALFGGNYTPKSNGCPIEEILQDTTICKSYKEREIHHAVRNRTVSLDNLKVYLLGLGEDERYKTENRKLLCLYDLMMYAGFC